MKNYLITSSCVIGQRHARSGKASDDVVHLTKKDHYCFIGLADGQTNKIYSGNGGKMCLEITDRFLAGSGDPFLSGYSFVDEAQYALVSQYRQQLRSRALQEAAWPEDYSSTIVALAFRPETGEYGVVHLGDGCILAVTKDNEVVFLSRPENGIAPGSTWLTTSATAMQHLRFASGNLNLYKRIVLLTDGAESLCRGMYVPPDSKERLIYSSASEIREWLEISFPEDDASCIILDCPAKQNEARAGT